MRIINTKVYGLEESIIRSGYPMSTEIHDLEETIRTLDMVDPWWVHRSSNPHVKRAIKLANTPTGSGHDCFLKGIIVQADIEAPQYWWQQWQRYHFADIISSQSKMHKILEMNLFYDFAEGCFSSMALENASIFKTLHEEEKCDFEDVLDNIPMGLELTAAITTNYLQLKTMYAQRKNHRLTMWNKIFKEWVESLPLVNELGIVK